jgi:hypothetical protein
LTDLDVISLAVSGTNLLAGTKNGAFSSINNGTGWSASDLTYQAVTAVAFSGGNLVAGVFVGYTGEARISISANNGTSWAVVDSGVKQVNAFAVSGTSLFAGTWGGVLLSTNNGRSWTAVNSGLRYLPVNALAVSGTNLFAGTYGGVFLSTNNGISWTAVNSGLTSTIINAFAVDSTYLYAGTDAAGVWRRPLSEMITGVEASVLKLPGRFTLGQNYPNPFNPSTTIRYALPGRAHVTLAVFNTLGQQVATLVNESEEAGNHDVRFDGGGLASGVYFYRLMAGTFVQTKKLLLLH